MWSPPKTKTSLQSSLLLQLIFLLSPMQGGKCRHCLVKTAQWSDGFSKFGFVTLGCSCRHAGSNIHLTRASGGKNFTIFGFRFAHGIAACLEMRYEAFAYLHLHKKETTYAQDQMCTPPTLQILRPMLGGGIMSHAPELSEQEEFMLTHGLSTNLSSWLDMLSLDLVHQQILMLRSP